MNLKHYFLKACAAVGVPLICLTAIMLFFSGCTLKPRIFRVGILSGLDFFKNTTEGFKEKMAELGYIEGKNVIYDCRNSNFDSEAYKTICTKFVADRVDLIFVFPTEASLEAKAAARGSGIPVLFANAAIEETGLIKSVADPGENITGVRWPGPDLAVKTLEIMHEVAPNANRIWLPFQKGYPTITSQLKVLRSAAADLGVTLVENPISSLAELKNILRMRDGLRNIGIDAVINIAETLAGTPEAFLEMCTFAQRHALPIGGSLTPAQGCESLFGVNVDHVAVGKKAAELAAKILSGVPADSLHVVSAETHITINYREIKRMGFIADEGLLSSANAIIR
jgi:putative tryptophan/tyrosine transport system substrate-binding protein